jgi:hypothetical protein
VAGTFPTAQGGSFILASDGSFTYVPPANYTGLDNVTYTASNGSGTATATVFFRVLPDVYVRLQQVNVNNGFIYGECSQGPEYLGESNTAIYRLFFYSNSAGTTPLDVTGLGLTINYRITRAHASGGPTVNDYDQQVNGSQFDLFGGSNYEFYHNETDCFGIQVVYWNDSITLRTGLYTII